MTSPNADTIEYSGMRRVAVSAVQGLGLALFTGSAAMVGVALPSMAREFEVDLVVVQWISLSFFIGLASFHLTAGRLSDIFGYRIIYLSGMLLFSAASIGAAISSELSWLIGWRILQALGASASQATGLALLIRVYPAHQRGRAMGIFGAVGAAGMALGPIVAGSVLEVASWHTLFLIMAGLGIISFAGGATALPKMKSSPHPGGFDWVGALLMSMWITPVILAVNIGMRDGLSNHLTIASIAATLLVLPAFALRQNFATTPLVHPSIFRSFDFTSSLIISSSGFATSIGVLLLIPFLLGNALNYPIGQVGLLLSLGPLVSMLVSAPAGAWADRTGPYIPRAIGLGITVLGYILLLPIDETWTFAHISIGLIVLSTGHSIWSAANRTLLMSSVSQQHLGVAGGLLSAARTFGFSIGNAIFGGIFSLVILSIDTTQIAIEGSTESQLIGFRTAMLIAAVMLSMMTALSTWRALQTHGS